MIHILRFAAKPNSEADDHCEQPAVPAEAAATEDVRDHILIDLGAGRQDRRIVIDHEVPSLKRASADEGSFDPRPDPGRTTLAPALLAGSGQGRAALPTPAEARRQPCRFAACSAICGWGRSIAARQ